LRVSSFRVWPEPVERIAVFLREAGVQGRLEELPDGVDSPPGLTLRAHGFESDGRSLVALVPLGRAVDRAKLATAAGSSALRPAAAPPFPYQPARVLLDRSAFAARTVWLEVASPRYALGLAPRHLAQLSRSETADLLVDDQIGGG
jgi:prolyl-tRNA editing enzyme YbaK/EbsC (Cys-tRNA(Pro) deacylase)